MKDRADFKLSDPVRIKMVLLSLQTWMNKNKVELFEVNRAIAMMLRQEDEAKSADAMRGTHGS